MHYMICSIEEMARYADCYCTDQISRIKVLCMAREFKLKVEGCNIWCVDVSYENKCLRETKTGLDALSMAMSVDSSKDVSA